MLLGCDIGRLVVYTGLAALVGLHHATIPLVIVAVGLTEMLDVLFSPAEMAALSSIVAGEQLAAACARNEARSNALRGRGGRPDARGHAEPCAPPRVDCTPSGDRG